MIEKYKISLEDETVVLKYNPEDRMVTIAGYARFARLIEVIAEHAFFQNLDNLVNTHSQPNYVQYKFRVKLLSTFRRVMLKLEQDYIVKQVSKHERLM